MPSQVILGSFFYLSQHVVVPSLEVFMQMVGPDFMRMRLNGLKVALGL